MIAIGKTRSARTEHFELSGEGMAATEEAARAQFPWRFKWVYSAKFLCGELARSDMEGPVQPGSYSTAINVHNPHSLPVVLHKKAVLLFDGRNPKEAVERPLPPTHSDRPVIKQLEPDWGLEIDCRDIRERLLQAGPGQPGPPAPTFIKGWVVIETLSDHSLDVVAVYTTQAEGAAAKGEPPSIAIERVPGTRLLLFG
jgi:hypothetical protein